MIYPEGVREELDRICVQNPDRLSPEDAAFLRAREYYLDDPERKKFAKILNVEPMDESDLKDIEEIKAAEESYDAAIADGSIDKPTKKVTRKKK